MTGADEADYRHITGMQSRTITFPDGLPRHITLTNWEWEVFDREHAETAPFEFLPQAAWRGAHRVWLALSFNETASPQRRVTDSLRMAQENAVDITGSRMLTPSRQLFENQVRDRFRGVIRASMPEHVGGGNPPLNDEFRSD